MSQRPESLGSIIKRIHEKLRGRERLPDEPEALRCELCHGHGWRRKPDLDVRDPEFGQLFPCECLKAEGKAHRTSKLLAFANLPLTAEDMIMDSFQPRIGTESAMDAVRQAVRLERPVLTTLSGTTGSGKTHLLVASAINGARNGATVRYEYFPDLLRRLRGTMNGENSIQTYDDVIYPALTASLLCLDEIGLRDNPTSWEVETLSLIIDTRLRDALNTLCATNLLKEELRERFGARLASRLTDIHTGSAHWVTLTAADYRTKGV